jgi:hypothetical protein
MQHCLVWFRKALMMFKKNCLRYAAGSFSQQEIISAALQRAIRTIHCGNLSRVPFFPFHE